MAISASCDGGADVSSQLDERWGTAADAEYRAAGEGSQGEERIYQAELGLEKKLQELGGRKVLYSQRFYTEEDFWALYDRVGYEELGKRCDATTLPTVFDKVKGGARKMGVDDGMLWYQRLGSLWPFAGFAGIWCAIKSKDYLLHRDLSWMRGNAEKQA